MKKYVLLLCLGISTTIALNAQPAVSDSVLNSLRLWKDSSFQAMVKADSIKVEQQYVNALYWEKMNASAMYPAIKAGDYSGVVPVANLTEIPDPKMEYKLLFEIVEKNPDSLAKELNHSLVEIARRINLHVASGIPVNKIKPVIVVHGSALMAVSSNGHYQQKYKIDNPNLKLMADLEKLGAKFIACGQAMAFMKYEKNDLQPEVKISLTAQTALSNYQLKGYVHYLLADLDK